MSHLLFADDMLVFCRDSENQTTYLCWILDLFEALLGLKINLSKSFILPVGRVENEENVACELGCLLGSLPTDYLGLPLGAKHNSISLWDKMKERFNRKLAIGKRQFISKAEG